METSVNYEASDMNLSASPDGDEFILNGKKLFVPYANAADNLLVIGRTDKRTIPKME